MYHRIFLSSLTFHAHFVGNSPCSPLRRSRLPSGLASGGVQPDEEANEGWSEIEESLRQALSQAGACQRTTCLTFGSYCARFWPQVPEQDRRESDRRLLDGLIDNQRGDVDAAVGEIDKQFGDMQVRGKLCSI